MNEAAVPGDAITVRWVDGVPPSASPGLGELLASGVELGELRRLSIFRGIDVMREVRAFHTRRLISFETPGFAATPLMTSMDWPVFEASTESRLSRFALVRMQEDRVLLESGRSWWSVVVAPERVSALLGGGIDGASASLLGSLGFLADADHDDSARGWEFHDRYFASRSRQDFTVSVPERERMTPRDAEPASEARFPGAEQVPLAAPVGPEPDEPSLWHATESRRSVTALPDAAVPLDSLGHLLWRTLRVVETVPRAERNLPPHTALRRPVPSGGGMHATDLWLLTNRVADLDRAIWWYDPSAHCLVRSPQEPPSPAPPDTPWTAPVVGVLTVRHARTAWKYGQISLDLELKDVGVIMHALQLSAPAVGLAAWLQGSGPTRSLGVRLGIDDERDHPLGEFAIGVR